MTGLLSSSSGPSGTTSYTHDALGQMTQRSTPGGALTTYAYNATGRMTSTTEAGATTTYAHDGDGRRLSSLAGGVTSKFVWEPVTHKLVAETDATNVVKRRYSYGLGALGLERPDQANPGQAAREYFHLDRMGSVRSVTNAAGSSHWAYEWEPYGVPRVAIQVDPSAGVNPIGWTGEFVEPVAGSTAQAGGPGAVHLRARQYDPALGRFIAPDPASAVSFSATGSYANGNPLTYTDPYGLWPDWGSVWSGMTQAAPAVATVAGIAAPFTGPAAPLLGGIALAAGAITTIDAAYGAYQVCSGAEKGSCAGEIATGALGIAMGGSGAAAMRVGLAARRAAKAGDGLLAPGPYAGRSIPGDATRRWTRSQRDELNEIMDETGCHRCGTRDPGTKSGDAIPDHQPPLSQSNGPFQLYPHCLACSREQGLYIANQNRGGGK